MKTTLTFNISVKSSNSQAAYNTLLEAGLNPYFSTPSHSRVAKLTLSVESGSNEHDLAKSYLFNPEFNKNLA